MMVPTVARSCQPPRHAIRATCRTGRWIARSSSSIPRCSRSQRKKEPSKASEQILADGPNHSCCQKKSKRAPGHKSANRAVAEIVYFGSGKGQQSHNRQTDQDKGEDDQSAIAVLI